MRGQPTVLLPRSIAGLNREHGSLRADAESQHASAKCDPHPIAIWESDIRPQPGSGQSGGHSLLLSNDGTRTRRDDRVRQAARELGWQPLPMSRTAMHAEATVSTPIAPPAATGPGDNHANNACTRAA